MAKFAIACPQCGNYAQASKFWIFGSKKVQCSCGYEIDVQADKLTSRVCNHCGNNVVFDQSKGNNAKCPVCGERVNTQEQQSQIVTIHCRQCGVELGVDKTSTLFECPLCGFENDVLSLIESEKIKSRTTPIVIKYEGAPDVLVWKHPIEDFVYGSQLIVHETQEAIFFCDGQALDSFGAGRHTLETSRMPLLGNLVSPIGGGTNVFHAEVYYVNVATVLGAKWGTDTKVRLFDPASGLHLEIGASGEFNVRITNARKLLLKAIGTGRELSSQDLLGGNGEEKTLFRALVMGQVKSGLARVIREKAINILEIDEYLLEISECLRVGINKEFEKFGLELSEFVISRVITPDDNPEFQRLKMQHAEMYLKVRQEQILKREAEAKAERRLVEMATEARLKAVEAGGDAEVLRIQKQAEADALRMMSSAEAEKMRMQGYTYQQQTQREVGLAAMKNGLTGGGGSGGGNAIGELASLGIGLGTMGIFSKVAQESITPITQTTSPSLSSVVQQPSTQGWNCSCGMSSLMSKFCPECGKQCPMEQNRIWDCACGQKSLSSLFCPECGAKRNN